MCYLKKPPGCYYDLGYVLYMQEMMAHERTKAYNAIAIYFIIGVLNRARSRKYTRQLYFRDLLFHNFYLNFRKKKEEKNT